MNSVMNCNMNKENALINKTDVNVEVMEVTYIEIKSKKEKQ